jgi:hypothetical protein
MRAAVLRAFGVSLVVAALCHTVAFTDFAAFCQRRLAWQRVNSGVSPVILDNGFGVARPGDAIFACESSHCFDGVLACHPDLDCVCAPATLGAEQVGALMAPAGRCVVDQPAPSLADESGACRHARCGEHVSP